MVLCVVTPGESPAPEKSRRRRGESGKLGPMQSFYVTESLQWYQGYEIDPGSVIDNVYLFCFVR